MGIHYALDDASHNYVYTTGFISCIHACTCLYNIALYCVYHVLYSIIQDWSDHVNVQKAVLPGVWQLLSGGGHGSARLAYPCLLQLLKKLVKQVSAVYCRLHLLPH